MKYALITGANKSIGFEAARQLLQAGYYVYLGSRNLQNGEQAVAQLHAEGLTQVEPIQLDVTDSASIQAARQAVGQKTTALDVLINNAGISGGLPQTAVATDVAVFKDVYNTNLFGVVETTQAFLDLLRASAEPRIVNVTSGLGSVSLTADPSWRYYDVKLAAYNSSKAALNMYTIMLAYELRDTPFKVNAVDPGYTATDFNGHSGPGSVPDAAARVVKYALIDANGPTGKFFSEEHNPETGEIPW
ncbi:SDR family oxidoreductase [Hymenobacter terrenus]|uniref:SDR family oxidoreductase n=1 Tax=Hymenobacter terrenus TaxID=1629124 RepID=UPI000619D5A7|nr:SDR family oxidoreductase [Hymenobacter terrenus]